MPIEPTGCNWNRSDLLVVTAFNRQFWNQYLERLGRGESVDQAYGISQSLQLLFDQGYNLTDVGAMFGVSRERVRQWAVRGGVKRFRFQTPPRVWNGTMFIPLPIQPYALARMQVSAMAQHAKKQRLGSLIERFWSKVQLGNSRSCWLWTGLRYPTGYGQIWYRFGGIGGYAHRAAYLFQYGESPSGKVVMHRCDNPPCVNPSHLRLGTHRDNIQDAIKKHGGKWGYQLRNAS